MHHGSVRPFINPSRFTSPSCVATLMLVAGSGYTRVSGSPPPPCDSRAFGPRPWFYPQPQPPPLNPFEGQNGWQPFGNQQHWGTAAYNNSVQQEMTGQQQQHYYNAGPLLHGQAGHGAMDHVPLPVPHPSQNQAPQPQYQSSAFSGHSASSYPSLPPPPPPLQGQQLQNYGQEPHPYQQQQGSQTQLRAYGHGYSPFTNQPQVQLLDNNHL